MPTAESIAEARALTIGLGLGGQKRPAIATKTVLIGGGRSLKFCQYPDSFCVFERTTEWVYRQCTCQIEVPKEPPNPWTADQIINFPDFFGRGVQFCRWGDRIALFVDTICQGYLADDSGCEILHTDTLGWKPDGDDSSGDGDDDSSGDGDSELN